MELDSLFFAYRKFPLDKYLVLKILLKKIFGSKVIRQPCQPSISKLKW